MKLISLTAFLLQGLTAYATPQLFDGRGSSGGNLIVDCPYTKDPSTGKYRVSCPRANSDLTTLKSEHILWLRAGEGQSSVVDIVVPNYKIQELIKAGFKTSQIGGPRINVLLRRPEQTYDAQVGENRGETGPPQVKLQYEPVQSLLVHYPNDKPYSPLRGPLLPPLAPGLQQGRQLQIDPRVGSFPR